MVEHHTWTGLLLLLTFILVTLAGVFLVFAQSDVTGIPEHDDPDNPNQSLRNASSNLIVSYILAFSAAAVLLVLCILYFFQGTLQWSEIPHALIYILIGAATVVSVIFAFVALSDIDESGVKDNLESRARGWIITSIVLILVGLLVLIISGAWRVQHVQSQKQVPTAVTQKTEYTVTQPTMEPPLSAAPASPIFMSP